MSSTQSNEASEIIKNATAKNITSRDRAYLLQYRFVNKFGVEQGKVQEKAFWFQGDLGNAKNRARLFCERMGYRYVWCHAFIVDLDVVEEMKFRNEEEYQKQYE